MSVTELIKKLVVIPDGDPRLDKVATLISTPCSHEAPFLSLTEVAKEVRYHPTWLRRLRVPEACGTRIAGRLRYNLSEVMAYLTSAECQRALAEHREVRKQQASPVGGGHD